MKKVFTLFIMCLFATAFAVAEETTVTFSDLYGTSNVQPATDVSSGSLAFSFTKGNASTEPAYNAGSNEMRLYGGGSAETPNHQDCAHTRFKLHLGQRNGQCG